MSIPMDTFLPAGGFLLLPLGFLLVCTHVPRPIPRDDPSSTLERSQFLHLFLHARSLLSASVRLNTLGPYAAQQLLLHAVRPMVEREATRCRDLRTGYDVSTISPRSSNQEFDETTHGPAVTWPLGEILAARHDLQHSRIFNS